MRVRGRARDVEDAEPHHRAGGARAQAAQPVPAAAAAVGRQVPPLPGLLDQGRRRRRWCRGIALPAALFDFSSLLCFSVLVSIYLSTSLDGL